MSKARCPFLMVVALLLICSGCREKSRAVTVLISGDTRGWITPCGCTSNQSGGLARRDSIITAAAAEGPVLVLDVGGAVDGVSQYDWEKLQAILRGQQMMGLDAFNLGETECGYPPEKLRELQSVSGVPFVSANVRDSKGELVAAPFLRFERGGQSFSVVGVTDPDLVGDAMHADDPYRAIFDLLPQLVTDRIVVLAYMDQPLLRELARKLPDVDAVIGGPTGQAVAPVQVGSVLLASCTNKGKFLLNLEFKSDGSSNGNIVEVDSGRPVAQRQMENLDAFYLALSEADFAPQQTNFVSSMILADDSISVAGSNSCVACHQMDDSVWHDSKHSHAWSSLQSTGAEVDPACQRCHTTGYGLPGGFRGITSSSAKTSVGCENCHGPSAQHVADPRKRTPYLASQQCVRCHDHENSPKFRFDEYWAKVFHGPRDEADAD